MENEDSSIENDDSAAARDKTRKHSQHTSHPAIY